MKIYVRTIVKHKNTVLSVSRDDISHELHTRILLIQQKSEKHN